MNKVLAVDFDGVIHDYSKGWHDGSIYDDPVPGTRDALRRFKDAGWRILIHTVRAHDRRVWDRVRGCIILEKAQLTELGAWLKKHKIPYHEVWIEPGKPIADVYLDDRARHFTTWARAINELL